MTLEASRTRRRALLLLSALVALVGWPAPVGTAAGASERSLFAWRVRGRGSAEVYVLGSVPVRDTTMLRFDPAVMEAFQRSDRLVLLNDAVEGDQFLLILNQGRLAEGQKLNDLLAPPLYARVRDALEKGGHDPETVGWAAPWLAAWFVYCGDLARAHYVDGMEFDLYFAALARDRKPVVYLEPAVEGYERLAALSHEVQSKLLEATLLASDRALEMIPRIEDDWRRGDAEDMARALSAVFTRRPDLRPAYEQTLFRDSARLADFAVSQLEEGGRAFLLAPSRALVGEWGVLALLAKRGLELEQLAAQSPGEER